MPLHLAAVDGETITPGPDPVGDRAERLRAAADIIGPAPGRPPAERMFWTALAALFTDCADNLDALPRGGDLPRAQRLLADAADGYLLSPHLDGRRP